MTPMAATYTAVLEEVRLEIKRKVVFIPWVGILSQLWGIQLLITN